MTLLNRHNGTHLELASQRRRALGQEAQQGALHELTAR
jgi:hypothetical protein